MASVKKHKIETHIGDYLRDPISLCSFAAQGLFRSIEFLLSDSERFGYLLTNGKPTTLRTLHLYTRGVGSEKMLGRLLDELVSASILARSGDGTLYCQQMIDREKRRAEFQKAGKKGGNPVLTLNPKDNPTLNLPPVVGKWVIGNREDGVQGEESGDAEPPPIDRSDDDDDPRIAAPPPNVSTEMRPDRICLPPEDATRVNQFCERYPDVDMTSGKQAAIALATMLRTETPEKVKGLIDQALRTPSVNIPVLYAFGIYKKRIVQEAQKPKHSSNEEWLRKPVTQ